MSDSLQPHGQQPTRLLCPWDFPGKNTGVGCHFLLPGIFLTRGLNSGLPHCRQMLYPLSHQKSPERSLMMQKSMSKKFKVILISNRNHTKPRSSYLHPLCFPLYHTSRVNGSASPVEPNSQVEDCAQGQEIGGSWGKRAFSPNL